MRRLQVPAPTTRRPMPRPLDLRTPSGRPLPF